MSDDRLQGSSQRISHANEPVTNAADLELILKHLLSSLALLPLCGLFLLRRLAGKPRTETAHRKIVSMRYAGLSFKSCEADTVLCAHLLHEVV